MAGQAAATFLAAALIAIHVAHAQPFPQTRPGEGAAADPASETMAHTRPLQPSTFLAPGASPLQTEHLFGTWGGVRTALTDAGVSPYAQFITESAGNPTGGAKHAGAYAHQFLVGTDIDLDRIARLPGLQAHVVVVNREGSNVSGEIGNLFNVQEIYGGGNHGVRLAYLDLEQSLLDGRVGVLAGRMLAGTDFAASQLYCVFQNLGLCPNPESLYLNGGFAIFPYTSWGGRARARVADSLYVQGGAFEVNPTLAPKSGWNWSTGGSTGALLAAEAGWTPGRNKDALPGHYKAGVVADTSTYPDLLYDTAGRPAVLTGAPARTHHGRRQAYLLADQMVRRSGEGDLGGLVLLGGFVWSEVATSRLSRFAFAGLTWTGLVPSRPHDGVSLLALYGKIGSRLAEREAVLLSLRQPLPYAAAGVQSSETVLEADYTVALAKGAAVMPNVQYILRPGATSTHSNALVLGLRTQVSF